MSDKKPVIVPKLDHDEFMKKRFGTVVSLQGKAERKIVAHLCAHLIERGFTIFAVFDGDTYTEVHTDSNPTKAAMELIFNLDEASLRISSPGLNQDDHGILLVLGNGCDIVSDWTYSVGDADGFNDAMDAFEVDNILFD